MDADRIHRARSADGTEIAGRVHGRGDALVLVHGGLEDGDLCWESLVPQLCERFTCYLMSRRSRGLSGAHPDLSPPRLLEDVTAFVDSIGEPVRVLGESDGGPLALGAAAQVPAVSAVAVYEPVVLEVAGEDVSARLDDTLPRVAQAAADGGMADGARIFTEMLANDEELDALSTSGYFDACARYVPTLLAEFEQADRVDGPGATSPSVLERITVPALALHGSRTVLHDWFAEGARHVADHVADGRVREIDGAGHWGPVVRPGPIADELVGFLDAA